MKLFARLLEDVKAGHVIVVEMDKEKGDTTAKLARNKDLEQSSGPRQELRGREDDGFLRNCLCCDKETTGASKYCVKCQPQKESQEEHDYETNSCGGHDHP